MTPTTDGSPAPRRGRSRSTATTCSSSPNTSSASRPRPRSSPTGNVVFVSGDEPHLRRAPGVQHQGADRHVLQRLRHRRSSRQGAARARSATQEPNAFFWGDELHQLGPKKYRIVRGGFTACVQPTPRWEVGVGFDHAQPRRLRAADERGLPGQGRAADVPADLLLPDAGGRPVDRLPDADLRPATLRGPDRCNAFFWAIGRSHDATFAYDWFSKAGQAVTGEYRYMLAPGSQGTRAFNTLNETDGHRRSTATREPRPAQRATR